jgi:V8-like Glu-specific endopeptidase
MNSDFSESFVPDAHDSEADEATLTYIDGTESFLDRAEHALRSSGDGRERSEKTFLQRLVRELGGSVIEPELSPAALFRDAVNNGRLIGIAQDLLRVVGLPLRLPVQPLRAGDWMVRVVPGTGDIGHVAVLASGDLHAPDALDREGIAGESTQPGYYGTVLEGGAFPHSREDAFARRLLDSGGRVPPHTLFLRPELPGAGEEEDVPVEVAPPGQTVVERPIPLAFFRLKFDEFVTTRKQPLVGIRIHNNEVTVTFAKDLADVHGLKPRVFPLGHLEAELDWLPNPNITIKDLNSNRVTADAIIVNEPSTPKGKTVALTADIDFETKGTELELNNFGDVDLQQLRIHVEFALIREVQKGRGVIGFRPAVRADVKATMNMGPDGMARRKAKSKFETKILEHLRIPRVHEEFSRALTRWLVGGEWEVQSLDLVGTELRIKYVEPPRTEFVQVFPEQPQKPLTPGNLSKVDHIVVVMMENRSFDHMLGYLKLIGGRSDVDGLTGKELNTFKGQQFRPFHLTSTVFDQDPCHERDCVQQQIRNDTMQGFVASYAAKLKPGKSNPGDVMGFYDANDVPVFDALAREFVVCDRWYAAHPGPTFPNRFYTMTGRLGLDQFGQPVFSNPDLVTYAPSQTKTIFDHLTDRKVTWKYYEHGYCFLRLFHRWVADDQFIRPGKEFFADAAAGKLPAVTFIDPDFIEVPPANDDHAPADVRDGQRLIGRIVNALMKGKGWDRTLLLITYDEHGGFYDHVVPPRAVNVSGEDRYGVRVPTLVVSPLVERGKVSHTIYDHTSILKTIVRRFCAANPPDLGARVAAAADVGPLLTLRKARSKVPVIKLPAPSSIAPKEAIDEEALLTDTTSLRSFHGLLAATRARYARAPVTGKSERPSESVEPTEEEDDAVTRPCRGKIGRDDRVPVRQAWDIPHRWICSVSGQRRKGGQLMQFGPLGTGVLISPRFVLTAAHLLHDSKKDRQGQWVDTIAERIFVTPARDDDAGSNSEPFGKWEAKRWCICPKYKAQAKDSWRYDYALIELKNPAGAKRAKILNNQRLYFWGSREGGANTMLEVMPANQVEGTTGITAGYPGDLGGGKKPFVATGTLSGVDLPNRREIMRYDADACPGQSGSPIWIERNSKRYLVGIVTKGATGYIDTGTTTITTSNQALRITQEVFDQISKWLEAVMETPWLDAQESDSHEGDDEGSEPTEEDDEINRPCTGIIGNDDRRPVNQAWDIPHRWICQISAQRRKGGRLMQFGPLGTGVLISPHFVLTAAHLLHGSKQDNRGQWVDSIAERVVVTPARDDNAGSNSEPFGKYDAKVWHLCPKYNARATDSWKYDYAIIQLEKPVGATRARVLNNKRLYFWGSREGGGNTNLEVLPANQIAGRTGFTAGYPGDLGGGTKPYATSGMLSGVDIRNRREVMGYDADGCPGQSGSPIWIERNGKRELVGIFTMVGTGYDATTGSVSLNQAVRITQEVFDQISKWLEAVKETPWLDAQESDWYEVADEGPWSTQEDDPKPTVRNVAVGERVEIDLTKTYGADLAQVRWTIPGRVVGGYEATINEAKIIEIAPSDLERPKISFFWIDPGQNVTVRAEIKRKSGANEQFVRVFDVEAPKATLSGTPGATCFAKVNGVPVMQFGRPRDVPGVRWKWNVTMPAQHAGFIKDVQTVLTDRSKRQRLTPSGSATRALRWRHPSNKKAHVQLDGDSDNQPIYTPGMAEEAIEAGKSRDAGGGTEDSPSTPLASLDKLVAVNDTFSYFLMFKPKTARPEDAIWVPIAKATWSWKATADHGQKWTLRKASKMDPVVDLAKVDFPVYQSNASDNEWQEASTSPNEAFEAEDVEEAFEETEESEVACDRCR